MKFYRLNINPIQWAIGPVTTMRRGGKSIPIVGRNVELHNYKEAVRSELHRVYGKQPVLECDIELRFWFWRDLPEYKTHQARTARKHQADATNMQKSTEDALQGVLFKNDKQVRRVSSEIIQQSHDTWGHLIIGLDVYDEPDAPPWDDPKSLDALPFEEPAPLWVPPNIEEVF